MDTPEDDTQNQGPKNDNDSTTVYKKPAILMKNIFLGVESS
jgi:hypothetical protein